MGSDTINFASDRIRVKHYSIRTETQYVQWVRRFILFHGKRHPPEMGAGEAGDPATGSFGQDRRAQERGIRMRHQPAAACGQRRRRLPAVCQPESGRFSINNPDTAFTHRLPSASRISPST